MNGRIIHWTLRIFFENVEITEDKDYGQPKCQNIL